MPYSAALISLSVPSTPTRSTLTRTPRPPGTSSTDGLGSCPRCMELGLPGNTAMAFIIAEAGLTGLTWRAAVATAAPRSVLGMDHSLIFYQLNGVTIGVTHDESVAHSERDHAKAAPPDGPGCRGEVGNRHCGLPVHQIVRTLVARIGPAVARVLVLQELDPRARGCAKAGDVQPGARHVVQPLLLGPEVHALARHPETQSVAIEREAAPGVVDHDGGVVDPEEEPAGLVLPLGVPL